MIFYYPLRRKNCLSRPITHPDRHRDGNARWIQSLVSSWKENKKVRRHDQQQQLRPVPGEPSESFASPQEGSMLQQEAFLLPSRELITAVAQPTPDFTLSASTGQLREQAPHSMQASRSAMSIFPLVRLRTAWGQTRRQVPQPVHFSRSSFSVTTSFR